MAPLDQAPGFAGKH